MAGAKRWKVLLTGALGRVGRAITPVLRQDYDLTLTDRQAGEVDGLPVRAVDLLDAVAVAQALEGHDAVVHLAIASQRLLPGQTLAENDDQMMRVNLMGTQHVYAGAASGGVQRVVYMSSLTVQLRKPLPPLLDPRDPARPRDLYACTKWFGEVLGEVYAHDTPMSVICLRLGQPYPLDHMDHTPLSTRMSWPRYRGAVVGYPDTAHAVRCALRVPNLKFHVCSIVSEGADRYVDLTAARKIGYIPQQYVTPQGLHDLEDRPQ